MKLNFYSTRDYENQGRLRTQGKQTQSNPTCSELACPEGTRRVEPVEGVEPISKAKKSPLKTVFSLNRGNFSLFWSARYLSSEAAFLRRTDEILDTSHELNYGARKASASREGTSIPWYISVFCSVNMSSSAMPIRRIFTNLTPPSRNKTFWPQRL